ncbi:hypothetical protein OUZ56_031380 [Daphnia magna]|uniref:Uncharacterized protein n=1 Tax=Daphnia magna TaxID=35525 RepID=A0ABQ9ZU27_9CRUS|nr:hypothetical protein OUZ56_031380 [Daphnia magna]
MTATHNHYDDAQFQRWLPVDKREDNRNGEDLEKADKLRKSCWILAADGQKRQTLPTIQTLRRAVVLAIDRRLLGGGMRTSHPTRTE